MDATALLCNICPKHPKFSDVSHLLTHVASKAHLSHYFKLQVRSHQEPQAEALLEDYNQWYKANNLAKLLSDRMSSKDSRRRKSQGKYAVPDTVGPTDRDNGYQITPLPTDNPHNNLPDYIDPRLSDPFLSSRNNAGYPQAPTPSPHEQTVGSVPDHWKRENEDDSSPSLTQATPCWPNPLRSEEGQEAKSLNGPFIYDPFVDDNDSLAYSNGSEVDKDRADEISRLKGVLWPGMDIFDSATEQMKRKRNQKKDESILKMMERTSMGVEPTELVFSPTGVLRKQRVISGNVEDSSPLKGETPIPKKRATRPKRVLAQLDPNAQREVDGKRAKKNIRRDGDSFGGEVDQPHLYTPERATVQTFGRLGGQMSVGDNLEEFALALRDHDFKQHSKFTIFRDMSVPREPRPEDQHRFVQGETAASQPLFLRRDIAINADPHSPRHATHSSNLLEKGSRTSADKENMEPMLNAFGRIDPLVGWHSPVMKRTDRGLSPQFLFGGDAHYVGYSPFECQESPSGYSFNPLAGSLTKLATDENPIYAAEPENALKAPSAARVSSPDATISEVADDDFDRLYMDGSS
ncbi:uncharacterized protein DSM5745_01337 [Aspergillus mulundensis]|uniref:Uncharacterized protein n=1 Tax=Aspergillus mulundensis TaxID=1810919 RepID=A0A3D8T636_9EURO|nr:Uncharacterized protein DSM5745_01337 [Aspergillus mulundensis]RDW94015.1 Uncharacterized protein DSM5745_01337 [Aspergillus mulundensis]